MKNDLTKGEHMTITYDEHGNVQWHFYRKAYKKARYRRAGKRQLDFMLKCGYNSGLIIVE